MSVSQTPRFDLRTITGAELAKSLATHLTALAEGVEQVLDERVASFGLALPESPADGDRHSLVWRRLLGLDESAAGIPDSVLDLVAAGGDWLPVSGTRLACDEGALLGNVLPDLQGQVGKLMVLPFAGTGKLRASVSARVTDATAATLTLQVIRGADEVLLSVAMALPASGAQATHHNLVTNVTVAEGEQIRVEATDGGGAVNVDAAELVFEPAKVTG